MGCVGRVNLRDSEAAKIAERRAWWVPLKWYFGYCSRMELRDSETEKGTKLKKGSFPNGLT